MSTTNVHYNTHHHPPQRTHRTNATNLHTHTLEQQYINKCHGTSCLCIARNTTCTYLHNDHKPAPHAQTPDRTAQQHHEPHTTPITTSACHTTYTQPRPQETHTRTHASVITTTTTTIHIRKDGHPPQTLFTCTTNNHHTTLKHGLHTHTLQQPRSH